MEMTTKSQIGWTLMTETEREKKSLRNMNDC